MAHRRALEGLRRQALGGEAEAADIGRNVGNAQRPVEVAEVLEQARPVGPLRHGPVLLGGEAGGDEVHGRPGLVDGGDGTVARAGQGAGAFGDLAQHGVEVEAGCDAQARRAQPGAARAQRRVLPAQLLGTGHRRVPAAGRRIRPAPAAPARFGRRNGDVDP